MHDIVHAFMELSYFGPHNGCVGSVYVTDLRIKDNMVSEVRVLPIAQNINTSPLDMRTTWL